MDATLPANFFARLRTAREPERHLMAAILEDAVEVACSPSAARTRCDRKLLRDIDAWFAANDPSYVFSFVRICEALGIDAGSFRRMLASRRARAEVLHDGVAGAHRLAS